MKIRYLPRARADLVAISSYLRAHNPSAANTVITAIQSRIAKLADYPLMGTATDEPGTRELVVLKYPYKIYYRIDGAVISILHIRDARRRPWRARA